MGLRTYRLRPGSILNTRLSGGRTPYLPGLTYVEQASNRSFTLNATLRKTQSSSFTADAVLAPVVGTVTSSFTANAVLLRTQTGSFTANATRRTTQTGTKNVDAVIRRTQTGSFTVDAAKKRTQTGSFTANAIRHKTQAVSFTANAVKRKTGTGSLTVDAVIRKTITTIVTPVLVGSASQVKAWNAGTSYSINTPTGTVDGDVMLAIMASDPQTTDRVITPPAGWTLLSQIQANIGLGGDANYNTIFWKIASGEGVNQTFAWGAPDTSFQGGMSGGIVTFRYAGTPTVVGNTASLQSTQHTTSTLVAAEGSVVGVAFTGGTNVSTSWTPPVGLIELWDRWTQYVAHEAAYTVSSTSGGTKGPYTAQYSGGSFSTVAFIWSLPPSTSTGLTLDAYLRRDWFPVDAVIGVGVTTSSFTADAIRLREFGGGVDLLNGVYLSEDYTTTGVPFWSAFLANGVTSVGSNATAHAFFSNYAGFYVPPGTTLTADFQVDSPGVFSAWYYSAVESTNPGDYNFVPPPATAGVVSRGPGYWWLTVYRSTDGPLTLRVTPSVTPFVDLPLEIPSDAVIKATRAHGFVPRAFIRTAGAFGGGFELDAIVALEPLRDTFTRVVPAGLGGIWQVGRDYLDGTTLGDIADTSVDGSVATQHGPDTATDYIGYPIIREGLYQWDFRLSSADDSTFWHGLDGDIYPHYPFEIEAWADGAGNIEADIYPYDSPDDLTISVPYTAGTWYTLKAWIGDDGLGTGLRYLKIWERGTPEPDWMQAYPPYYRPNPFHDDFFYLGSHEVGDVSYDNFWVRSLADWRTDHYGTIDAHIFNGTWERSFTVDARIVSIQSSSPDPVTVFCDTFDRVVASGLGGAYDDFGSSGESVNGSYAVIAATGYIQVGLDPEPPVPSTYVVTLDFITPDEETYWGYGYFEWGQLWWEWYTNGEPGNPLPASFGLGQDTGTGNYTYIDVPFEPQVWYTIKAELGATQIRAKFWKRGTTEPDWQIVRTRLTYADEPLYLELDASEDVGTGLDNFCVSTTPPADFPPFTVNAVITKKTGLGGVFLLSALILRNSFTVNARLGPGFQAYALLRAARTSSFTANAWVNAVGTKVSSFTLDAKKRKTGTGSFTVNAYKGLLITHPSTSYALDAILVGTAPGTRTFTLDASVHSGTWAFTFAASADLAAQGEVRSSFTASALLGRRAGGVFLASAFIGTNHAFTLDAFFVGVVPTSFTVNAVLHKQYSSAVTYEEKVLRDVPVWYMPMQYDPTPDLALFNDSLSSSFLGSTAGGSFTAVAGGSLSDNSDGTYWHVDTNASGTYTHFFNRFRNFPTDMATLVSMSVDVRYGWATSPLDTWDSLSIRFYKSDQTTPLTDDVVIATNITASTPTTTSAVSMTGIDLTATRADWQGSDARLTFVRTKVGVGTTTQQRVYKAEYFATYTRQPGEDIVGTDDGTFGDTLVSGQPGPPQIEGATSAYFGVTDDYITMANLNAVESQVPVDDDARSYELWFRNANTGIQDLIADGGPNSDRHRFDFSLNFISNATNDPDYLTLLTWGDDPNIYVPSQVHNDDQWHHLVLTYGEASLVVPVWIDGVMVGELILGDKLATSTTNGVVTGGSHRLGNGNLMWMTHAAVYARVLEDSEIIDHAVGSGEVLQLTLDAIFASTTGVIPTRQYTFGADAMIALYPQTFTADALLIRPTAYGTFTLDAWFLGTLTTHVGNPPLWLAAVIRGSATASSFTLNAFLRKGMTVDAWIADALGGLYGGHFSVDAYLTGGGLVSGGPIVWPDDGGPAEFPDGEFVPVWYKAARKFRVRIFVAGGDITGTVIWSKTTFTQNAKTNAGTFELALEGIANFDGGEEVWVTLDDYRVFGGIVLSIERTYAFAADAGTPLTTLRGSDFNVLLDKYVVYNTAEATGTRGEYTNYASFAKGTLDSTIIHKVFEDYIDPPINHTDYVDTVAVANPEKPWAMPTPGTPIRQVLQSISQITSAVWWIDAYKNLHYHSRAVVTAPYPITSGLGGISSANLSVSSDISKMVTETYLWGTLAQTVAGEIMVAHEESDFRDTYGLWQFGEVRADIHHQAYIDRRARSIIERYGVPVKKAKATIYEPGFQAGMVARVILPEHDIDEPLVIREFTLEFAVSKGKLNDIHYCVPRYQLVIGLDPEEPWDIYDYLPWPDDKGIPWQPYNYREIGDECLDFSWTNPCVEQGGFRGGALLDSFDRTNEDIYHHYDLGDGRGGRDETPDWGTGQTVTWNADTFIKNYHYAVGGSYGVINAMNAHYVHVNEQNSYYPSSKGQSTTVPMNDLQTGDAISMKALLFGFRIQPTERIINSVLTSAGEFNRINWNDTGAMTDTTGIIDPKPNLETTARGDATVSAGPTLLYAGFTPAEGGNITGTVLVGDVDDAGYHHQGGAWYGSDGGGMVSWQKRYANGTSWRPGQVGLWARTDDRSGLHYVSWADITAYFFIATDERRGSAWTNAVHIEFKSGNSYVRISRPEVGGGAYGVTTHTTSSGADTSVADGAITIDPAYDYYCKWWRPTPFQSYVKIWPQGGAEPDGWIASAQRTGSAVEVEPTNRELRIGASVFNMQMYDLMIDFVAAAPDEDDFIDCDEDNPCEIDDPEGEVYGVIGQGWNTERVPVIDGVFTTTARAARSTLQVFSPTGAFIPEYGIETDGITYYPIWQPLDGVSGSTFGLTGGTYTWVTCFYRAYVMNIGSEYREVRITGQTPTVRTIPP